jgi:hypothetical protein
MTRDDLKDMKEVSTGFLRSMSVSALAEVRHFSMPQQAQLVI